MLMTIDEVQQAIQQGRNLLIAGDETLLRQLPSGNWIGGTIPYFMTGEGGLMTKEKVYVNVLPGFVTDVSIATYDTDNLARIPQDAPENGFSVIIIPAGSDIHTAYAEKAPTLDGIFMNPVIGWIAGVHLNELGSATPKVFDGSTGAITEQRAVVMHCQLPADKLATISTINLFTQGDGDTITFENDGFSAGYCLVNGEQRRFADYLLENNVDIQFPLVANYFGAMINVSFQKIADDGTVVFYAPVFAGVEYKLARPIDNLVERFEAVLPDDVTAAFSCNCILNYVYAGLEGKKLHSLFGPITFGEIAYQLLNQTLVYMDIQDV